MFEHSERYRSGYNGTVLKTVVRQRTVGSNPTLSATLSETSFLKGSLTYKEQNISVLFTNGGLLKW